MKTSVTETLPINVTEEDVQMRKRNQLGWIDILGSWEREMYPLIRKVTDVGCRWFERVLKAALYWSHQSWLKMTRTNLFGNIFHLKFILENIFFCCPHRTPLYRLSDKVSQVCKYYKWPILKPLPECIPRDFMTLETFDQSDEEAWPEQQRQGILN